MSEGSEEAPDVQHLIEHARSFSRRTAEQADGLSRFASGQEPLALFITCSDSRVVPSLITGAGPGEDLSAAPSVRDWLKHATPLPDDLGSVAPDIAGAVQAHVLDQLERLRGYPSVARRLADERLRLHGWFYEVHTGSRQYV